MLKADIRFQSSFNLSSLNRVTKKIKKEERKREVKEGNHARNHNRNHSGINEDTNDRFGLFLENSSLVPYIVLDSQQTG